MAKIMGILALTFYFFALLFGLMLYVGVGQGGQIPYGLISKSMSPGEAAGYAAITPPSPDEIKELMAKERELQSTMEFVEAQLNKKQADVDDLTVRISKLQSELKRLDMEKKITERGQQMALMYISMKPEEAASMLGKINDEDLKWMVTYAFPHMTDKVQGKIMGQADQTLTEKIIRIIAEGKSEPN